MQAVDGRARRAGDDGARPSLPVDAGEAERTRIDGRKDVRLLGAARDGLPLVEAVGGDEAAPLLERLAEDRALGERLGPGVDQRRGALTSDKSPRHDPQHTVALVGGDGVHVVGGRHVVARCQLVVGVFDPEPVDEQVAR